MRVFLSLIAVLLLIFVSCEAQKKQVLEEKQIPPVSTAPTSTVPVSTVPSTVPTPSSAKPTQKQPEPTKEKEVPTEGKPVSAPLILEASLESPFLLRINQSGRISSENILIQFIELKEDSRCPVGVSCIWGGRVSVAVSVKKDGKDLGRFDLSTTERKGQYVDNYLLSMGKVEPSATGQLKPENYLVAFTVSKFIRKTT